jgi:hypothetical protein
LTNPLLSLYSFVWRSFSLKIANNEPCPCGSEKKYKHCCGTIDGASFQQQLLNLKVSREIAYLGKTGHIRKDYCIRYLAHKKASIAGIERELESLVAGKKETISCGKGCSYCCSLHISASLQECESLVFYLYEHGPVLSRFLHAYPEWRNRVRQLDMTFKHISRLNNEIMLPAADARTVLAYENELRNYAVRNIPCPFLDDNICLVYEVRPWVCASLVSTTPKEWCDLSKGDNERCRHVKSELYLTRETKFYLPLAKLVVSNMPVTVFQILVNGYAALALTPGLAGLDEQVRNEPEVKAALRKLEK